MTQLILASFVLTVSYITIASGSPLVSASSRTEVVIHLDQLKGNPNWKTELAQNVTNALAKNRARQDEGEVGAEVGNNVVQIISGVLGGGLDNIFQGSLGFVPDANVQEEASFVLKNVAPSLDVVLKYGFDGIRQYFGLGATTLQPEVNQQVNQTVAPVVATAAPAPPAAPLPAAAAPPAPVAASAPVAAPAPVAAVVAVTTTTEKSEDEDETDTEADEYSSDPRYSRSRVETIRRIIVDEA